MPILTTCPCGSRFKAPDRLAGKRVRCPKCSEILTVPAGETPDAPIEETAPPVEPAAAAPADAGQETPDAGPPAAPGDDALKGASAETDGDLPAVKPPEGEPATETPAAEAPAEPVAAAPEAPAAVEPPAPPSMSSGRTGRLKRDGTSRTTKAPASADAKPAVKAASKPSEPSAVGDYLAFRKMITPSLIKVLFWLGEFLLVLQAFGSFIAGIIIMSNAHHRSDEIAAGAAIMLGGPVLSVVWMLLWRVVCESTMLYFKMYERLGEVKDLLAKAAEESKATREPAAVVVAPVAAALVETPIVSETPAAAPAEAPVPAADAPAKDAPPSV
ncbi:MAG: DUF4282 domain-containing protein [Planctomycetes bacterium]|nr:DUF4282 domain-containing protein [Planctomycetota bacterium]